MREIMISIQPQWVEKILNGEKTIEIRKTMPKCELPCKVYIYCTNSGRPLVYGQENACVQEHYTRTYGYNKKEADKIWGILNGKVVAEFICDFILNGKEDAQTWEYISENSCVPSSDLYKYCGENEDGEINYCYGWHIDNLKIYDKPKELSDFSGFIPNNKCEKHENGFACDKCDAYDKEHETCLSLYYCRKPIKRPPQSWCYVKEVSNG